MKCTDPNVTEPPPITTGIQEHTVIHMNLCISTVLITTRQTTLGRSIARISCLQQSAIQLENIKQHSITLDSENTHQTIKAGKMINTNKKYKEP